MVEVPVTPWSASSHILRLLFTPPGAACAIWKEQKNAIKKRKQLLKNLLRNHPYHSINLVV